jgi:hypothetical protein
MPMSDADDRRLVDPQCHEYVANYNYNECGLRPWFACDRAVKDGGGSVEAHFDALGESWEVQLYYTDDSGLILPDGGKTPAGTTIDFEEIREYRLAVTALDDVRQKSVNYHLRPRWDGLEAEKNDGRTVEIPVPDELANHRTDAVNVRVQGSNIPFDEYNELLEAAAAAVGVSPHYFAEADRHRTSNVQDMARYVRLHTHESGPVHARTGPLVGLAHVLENDRSGYRKLVQNDDDEHNQNLPGYYHTATLGPDRVQEVMPHHELPVECKHYYAREALDRGYDDPLRHPKLEVAYQVSRWDGTVRPDDLEQAVEELDEWLYSILADAGLDLRAGGRTYVEDAYFAAENATTTASVVNLDLTEVRHEQESVVYRHLADGMSPVEQETLQTLVADGGDVSPQDIADRNDRHRDSVYDALGRMHDLVQHEYGQVSLKSTYVSELVADALEQAEAAVERATLASAKAVNAADRGLDERTSAFIAWCEKHGVNYDEDAGDRMRIKLGEVSSTREVRRILREGLRLWEGMQKDPVTFREASVTYRHNPGQDPRRPSTRDELQTRQIPHAWSHL